MSLYHIVLYKRVRPTYSLVQFDTMELVQYVTVTVGGDTPDVYMHLVPLEEEKAAVTQLFLHGDFDCTGPCPDDTVIEDALRKYELIDMIAPPLGRNRMEPGHAIVRVYTRIRLI